MPNLLQRGATFLGSRMQQAAGRSVVYSRRSQTVTLTGWPAMQEYEVVEEDGSVTLVKSYDWSFVASELNFANDEEAFLARPGDRIEETINGVAITYEAMPIGREPVSKPMDSSDLLILIHSKIVNRA